SKRVGAYDQTREGGVIVKTNFSTEICRKFLSDSGASQTFLSLANRYNCFRDSTENFFTHTFLQIKSRITMIRSKRNSFYAGGTFRFVPPISRCLDKRLRLIFRPLSVIRLQIV